jgi:hypothetical protein
MSARPEDRPWLDFTAHLSLRGGAIYEVGAFFQDDRWQIESVRPLARCAPGCDSFQCECRRNLEPDLTPLERAEAEDCARIAGDVLKARQAAIAALRSKPITQAAAEVFGRSLAFVKVLATLGALAVEQDGRGRVVFTTDGKGAPVEGDVSKRLTRRAAALRAKRAAEQHGDGTVSA